MARVDVHSRRLHTFLTDSDGPVTDFVGHVAQRVLIAAEVAVPVKTGQLLNSLGVEKVDAVPPYFKVGSKDVTYSGVVELGDPTQPGYPVQPYLRPALSAVRAGGAVGTVRGVR